MVRGGKVSAKRLSFVFLEELGKIRRRRIEGAGRSHRDVPVHLASGTSVMQLAQGKMKADSRDPRPRRPRPAVRADLVFHVLWQLD